MREAVRRYERWFRRAIKPSRNAQAVYDKAEPYLLRAVKASEVSASPDKIRRTLPYGRFVFSMIAGERR